MPTGGHNAKSTAELKQSGTYRADRHAARAENHVRILTTVPKPPRDFDQTHAALWKDFAKTLLGLRILAEQDLPMLRTLCETWVLRDKAHSDLNIEGIIYKITNQNGEIVLKENPANGLYIKYNAQVVQIANHFGLTPKARQTLKVEAAKNPEKDNQREALQNLFVRKKTG